MQIDQQLSQDVEKTIFPLKIIWLALSASILIYAFVILKTQGISFEDTKDSNGLKNVLLPFSFIPFVLTFFVSTKKNWLLNKFFIKKKSRSAPYLKSMSDNDQKYLAQFSPYIVFHVLAWAINESGAILGFLIAFTTGNFTYYFINGSIALVFNLMLFKPNYKNFKNNLR
jgi:hypothetical protein